VVDFRFYHPVEVRYGDLDPQGHVNNASYLTYMEQGRVAYIRHLGLWQGGSFLDFGLILADVHVSFRAPILFGDLVRVGVRVSRLGGKSLNMEYILEHPHTGSQYARGTSIMVAYDYHNLHSISLPDHWREVFVAFEDLK
jgi:acyl-CoA thioester hydrolase